MVGIKLSSSKRIRIIGLFTRLQSRIVDFREVLDLLWAVCDKCFCKLQGHGRETRTNHHILIFY